MSNKRIYESPLSTRYASAEMSFLFSEQFKYSCWRKLWLALARAEKKLGLPINDDQIACLEKHINTIDFQKAHEYEKVSRHDVMAHLYAFADDCPSAKPILHLGATSCFVTDNTDLIQMREGLQILHAKLIHILRQLAILASDFANLPCLGFTHFQAAQPTTVGKRCCLWLQDLLSDFNNLERCLDEIKFLGLKGATGTQASFLSLFEGNSEKVKQLEELVSKEMGFKNVFIISGQTYPRKQDEHIFSVLRGLASSAHKFGTDLRLLSSLKEVEESFTESQVGSSAMPYKRNPMRAERLCSLARFLISLTENPSYTASLQWLERTLDDSANRRIVIPEAFLSADALLNLIADLSSNLTIYPKIIFKHLEEELPFIATEDILMEAVKKGADRQALHEKLRWHAFASAKKIKEEGAPCDLIERIAADPSFDLTREELSKLLDINHFSGRAALQVEEFLAAEVRPLLKRVENVEFHIPAIEI
ncbi:MAG: adenylosuccinate lyase [Anaerolineae bacterium]